jgi:uncharacterized protein
MTSSSVAINKLKEQNDAVNQEKDKHYRILCIDGGGILGTFPASFLACIEDHLERPIGDYFDLIAGTSTGGIIAIGLALGLSASEVRAFYEEKGPEIFGQHRHPIVNNILSRFKKAQRLIKRKHSSEKLRQALEAIIKDRKLREAKTRLLIPAWNPKRRSVYIYKTAHHERMRTDYRGLAVDVALATSAAPTYLQEHVGENDVGLLDGGVWANNPISLAVVEAITLLGWPANNLHVLSLGCLEETYTIPPKAGLLTLGTKAIKLFMDG